MTGFVGGTGTAYAVPQTEIGIAKETTKGTPVAQPSYWIPVKAPDYTPDLTLIPDDTLQGSMVSIYNLTPGMRLDKHGWSSYPYLDSFPLFVMAELGSPDNKTAAASPTTLYVAYTTAGQATIETNASVAAGQYIVIDNTTGSIESNRVVSVAGSGAPYTLTLAWPTIFPHGVGAPVTPLTQHAFSLLNNAGVGNQPPSLTITDYDGEEWRQIAAAQMDELTIKGNATGLVTYTVTFMGNPSITPATPSVSYTTTRAVPGWAAELSIGGGTYIPYITEWEFDFKRGTEPIPALTGGQEYYEYFASTLECTGKITVVEQTLAPQLTQYLNGSTQALDFNLFDVTKGNLLNIHSTYSMWKTGKLDRSKKYVDVPLEVQMIPSTADANTGNGGGVSPVAITIANAVTTTY